MTHDERKQMWEEQVAAYKASGETVASWCAANDVKEHQLYYRLKQLDSKASTAIPSSKWMAFELENNDRDCSILVKVGQASIEVRPGFDPTLLADVVGALNVHVR